MTKNNNPRVQSIQQLPSFGNNVSAVVAKSQLLDSLSAKIQKILTPMYQGQCRVANVRGKTAVIQVFNYALATRLQYELPQLKNALRDMGLDINEVSIIVKPEEAPNTRVSRRASKPTAAAAQCLRASMQSIEDSELQEALGRLAQNFEK